MESTPFRPETEEKPSSRELQLLKMIRELGFGEIRIYVSDGQPVRAEEIKKSVKFN